MSNDSQQIDPLLETRRIFYDSVTRLCNLIHGLIVLQIILGILIVVGSCVLAITGTGWLLQIIRRLSLYTTF